MKELPEDIQTKIIAYIEGELPPDEAAALEVYLVNTDPGISEMVIGMMADRQSISVLPKISAPKDLAGNIMEQLERSSLLHGVEQDLQRASKPWWQSRPAIAAAVAIFVGSFSAIVIHTIYRSQGPGEVAGKPTSNTMIAVNNEKTMPDITEHKGLLGGSSAGGGGNVRSIAKHGGAVTEESDINSTVRLNKAANSGSKLKTPGGAPAWLVVDTRESIEDKLNRIPATVDHPVANGYLQASTPLDALASVSAAPDDALAGPPVVVFIQARDTADANRLEQRLSEFMHEDDFAPRNDATHREVEGKGTAVASATPTDSAKKSEMMKFEPTNTYTGDTTIAGGKLDLAASASTGVSGTGSLNVAGGIIVGGSSAVSPVGGVIGALDNNKANIIAGNNAGNAGDGGSAQSIDLAGANANQLNNKNDNDPLSINNNNDGVQRFFNKSGVGNILVPGNATAATNTVVNNGGTITFNNTNGYPSTQALNAGVIVNNASQAKNLHNGIPRGQGANFDSNLGQYAGNTNYREYVRTEQQRAVKQQDQKIQDSQNARDSLQDSKFVGDAGQPYRVYLSPEQLDQVASEFCVRSINRGQVTYVIPSTPAQSQAPASVVAVDKEALRAKEIAAAVSPKPVATATPAPATAPAKAMASPAESIHPGKSSKTPQMELEAELAKRQIDKDADVVAADEQASQHGGDQRNNGQQGANQAFGEQLASQGAGQGAGQQAGGQQRSGGFGGAGAGGGGARPGAKQAEEKKMAEATNDDVSRKSQRLEVIISIQPPAAAARLRASEVLNAPASTSSREASLEVKMHEGKDSTNSSGK